MNKINKLFLSFALSISLLLIIAFFIIQINDNDPSITLILILILLLSIASFIAGVIYNKIQFLPKQQRLHFIELSEEEQYNLINEFIEHTALQLKETYPEITGIFANKKHREGKKLSLVATTIQVKQKTDKAKPIPKSVIYKGYNIPFDIQEADFVVPNICLDSGISRSADPMFGTLGVPVLKDGKMYYLSCYHVYCNQELKRGKVAIGINDDINRSLICPCFIDLAGKKETIVGNIVEGVLTDFLDVAIMEPSVPIQNKFQSLPGPVFFRTLTRDDENKTFLRFWGNGSKKSKEAKVVNILSNQFINYEGKPQHFLKGLIQIEKCAKGGDSGSAVCDLDGKFVGCIIGSDDHFTYILSAYNIKDKTNYKFI